MAACRSCGGSRLHAFLSLGPLPLADALVDPADADRPEPRHPVDVALCRDCALVQLLGSVPPEDLFGRGYPYRSSCSDTVLANAAACAERLVDARSLGPGSLVVEPGSNDGYLLQCYRRRGIPVLGIDPAEGAVRAARERGIPTCRAFFDEALARRLRGSGRRADVLHASNVLAHVADPNDFARGIRTLIEPDGVAVVEVPYVRDLIERVEFDTIYHEHHSYFSLTALDALFRRQGLAVNDVERLPIHGGSLRVAVSARPGARDRVGSLLESEARAGLAAESFYAGFASRVEENRRELVRLLRGLRERGHRIAGYGAAAKGAVLLNAAGIGRDLVDFVVDRNAEKQGRLMPGTHQPILAPEALLEERPDYALLLAWNFADEIAAQQSAYLARGGRFIVPTPAPRVL